MVAGALREIELREGDQNFGAGFKVDRLQQRLFFPRSERTHHRERIDQSFRWRGVDARPVHLQFRGLREFPQHVGHAGSVDRVLAGPRLQIVGIVAEGDVGGAERRVPSHFRQHLEPAHSRQRDDVASVARLVEMREAADAANLVNRGSPEQGPGRG